jgi:hypothetical protein
LCGWGPPPPPHGPSDRSQTNRVLTYQGDSWAVHVTPWTVLLPTSVGGETVIRKTDASEQQVIQSSIRAAVGRQSGRPSRLAVSCQRWKTWPAASRAIVRSRGPRQLPVGRRVLVSCQSTEDLDVHDRRITSPSLGPLALAPSGQRPTYIRSWGPLILSARGRQR